MRQHHRLRICRRRPYPRHRQRLCHHLCPGDAIGVFILKDDGSLYADNLPVTLQSDGSTWYPQVPYTENATYYAYYPHQEGMSGKKSTDEILAAFATTASSDQSTQELYTAQDAMVSSTATPSIGTKTLSFTFAHARSLIEITLPSETTSAIFQDINPYLFGSPNVYRYLVPPGTVLTLSGSYFLNSIKYAIPASSITTPAQGGTYKKVTVE
ncbi:MAG: fimbrillin family protein [Bacteroides sp.]|nr:fimbrillin family protein [Bacteroides sp.]